MPQATEEDRDWIGEKFGSVEPTGPVAFLCDHGYIPTSSFRWIAPTADHVVTDEERRCIEFLINEWDWGSVIEGGLAGVWRDDSYPERECDNCHALYRGPSVYCSLLCALADA